VLARSQGKPGSPEEMKTTLTRLAKDADLDPLTMPLIVGWRHWGAEECAALFEQLGPHGGASRSHRNEIRARRDAPQWEATEAPWWPTTTELIAFAVGLAFAALLFCVFFTARWNPTPVDLMGAFIRALLPAFGFAWWRNREQSFYR
jgi:hypothetical protein